MAEAVRLVVWDLDETFWAGTLTEGGYRYVDAHHEIVMELARRGIMSSICSKNDHAAIEAILRERGIWDHFIFPSIDWTPKGVRIAALVEAVQLRPASVMFIDDNPQNLREAQHFTPGLQVETEAFIPRMLDDPRFRGKDDGALTRLGQYKVLERRKADEVAATQAEGSNVEFLRRSDIRVRLELDVEAHIDRAVELINRTNQLNFTKARLPEDPEAAREALLGQMKHHLVQGGLVHVADAYGDYGYCGFFLAQARSDGNRLLHFCFSCRILDMGVEAWLYQRLGRPALQVRGEVLSDPVAAGPVDWIRLVEGEEAEAAAASAGAGASSVAMRGGCVMLPLTHYFGNDASKVVGEFNTMRDGVSIRLDHTLCFTRAMEGMPEVGMNGWSLLGYRPEDFRSDFFEHEGPHPIWLFSNWMDPACPTYVHRKSGVRLPVNLPPPRQAFTKALKHAHFYLNEYFEPAGVLTEQEIKDNMRAVFARVPAHGRLFALMAVQDGVDARGRERTVAARARLNEWTREVADEFPTVEAMAVADFLGDADDVVAGSAMGHFDRMVYFRLYQRIRERMAERAREPAAVAA